MAYTMRTKITALFSLIAFFTMFFPALSIAEEVKDANVAKEVGRSITPACQTLIDYQEETLPPSTESSQASWNKHYRNGHTAIINGDLSLAEQEMCAALNQAKNFAERDWRFAETLDELGLIHFMLGQFNQSEKAQGAAVAELLLAAGPTTMRQTRTRKVSIFIERLGRVYAEQERNDLTEKLRNNPYKIYEMGYIPLDSNLARRLGWLVSEYLGLENLNASNELLKVIEEIKGN